MASESGAGAVALAEPLRWRTNLIGTLLRTPIRHLLYLRTHVSTVLESIHGQ